MKDDPQPLVDPVTPDARPWQKPLITRLLELRRDGRLPHALLIEMSTHADSRDFGWLLAQTLLCSDEENAPCGECENCRLMLANSHPDFSFVTLERNPKRDHKLNRDITVEQIRQLIHRLGLTRSQGEGRCALIYPAERMNREAANSLLKTLEEPAEGTTLILLTHHAARLPITIRSRCQRWRVEHPPTEQALGWLSQQGLLGEVAVEALQRAGNDPQRALSLEQDGFFDRQQAFDQQLKAFLEGGIDAPTLVQQQKELDNEEWRQLLHSSILQALRDQLEGGCDEACKLRLRRLLELQARSERPLQVEETNLNLQLQLEDLLISLKHAIHRG